MSDIACPLCVGVLDDECTECFGRGVISGPKPLRTDYERVGFYGIDLPGEEWKPYPKWNKYRISNYGRFLNTETGRLLKISSNPDGYGVIRLKPVGRPEMWETVHRLVASLFMPDYDPERQVIFKDGIITNYHIDNLAQIDRKIRGKGKKAA